jgi:hypothetical protein
LRIPDDLLTCPVFLGGRDSSGVPRYRGTGFLVGRRTKANPRIGWPCLVTARHCVLRALDEFGSVCIRVNTQDGSAVDVEINAPWTYPDNPASDIAVVPFPMSIVPGFEPLIIPERWFVTAQTIEERGIGIGEELVIMGLFGRHVGKARNLPIVRGGQIASMPMEPLMDDQTGEEYDAYLAEVRSIGGLSGSPVFVALTSNRFPGSATVGGQSFYLLGLVRGHWLRSAYEAADFGEPELDRLNTGIATVTPITELFPLFEKEAIAEYAKASDRHLAATEGPVKDYESDSESGEPFIREQFHADLEKATRRVDDESDEERA